MPSNVVDERIVKVDFDNDGFEHGVSDSLNSLEKFEKGLLGLEKKDFGDSVTDSFSDIQNAIDETDFNPITDALDSVGHGFSVLETIAIGALLRIGSKVADLGMNMVNSLTLEPIAEGFKKYTSSSKDIKGIMNQTGKSIEEVSEKVDALSWYSDATSYNYSAMVAALKSFSAQNIDMDEAIPMIMGLGNSLSYAGLAAEEATAGFDIYAKAIGRGYMDLRQWQRLNTMGASTADLKKQFMEAAADMGYLKKVGDDAYKTMSGLSVSVEEFEMSLGNQKGKWLTKDVIKKVLSENYGSYSKDLYEFSQQADNANLSINELMDRFEELNGVTNEYGKRTFLAAQEARTFGEAVNAVADAASSAWRKIFESIFGNAIESTELWTDFSDLLYDVFMGPLEGLSQLTTQWNALGGRTDLIQGFYNLVGSLSTILGPIKDAFGEVFDLFGESAVERITQLSAKFREWAFDIQLSENSQQKVHDTALSFAKVLGHIVSGIKSVLGYIRDLIKVFSPLTSIVGNFVYYLTLIGKSIKNAFSDVDMSSAYTIGDAIAWVGGQIEKVTNFINKHLRKATISIITFINSFKANGGIDSIVESIKKLKSAGSNVVQTILSGFSNTGASISTAIGNFVKAVTETIKKAFSKKDDAQEIESYGTNVVKTLVGGLTRSINNVSSGITDIISAIISGIADSIPKVQSSVQKFIISISKFITKTGGTILSSISAFISEIGPYISELIKTIFATGSTVLNDITSSGSVTEFISALIGLIKTIIPKLVAELGDLVVATISSLNGVLPQILESIGDIVKTIAMFLSGPVRDDLLSILGDIGVILLKAAISFLPAILIVKKVGSALLMIGAAILAFALAAKMLTNIDEKGIKNVKLIMNALSGFILVAFTLSAVISNLTALNGIKGVAALYITIGSISKIFNALGIAVLEFSVAAAILNAIDIKNALISLGALVASVAIVSALSTMEFNIYRMSSLSSVFSKISKSLIIFAAAAFLLKNADLTKTTLALMELTAAVTVLTILNDSFDVKKVKKLSKSFVTIAGSLVIFAAAALLMQHADLSNTSIALMELVAAISVLSVLGDVFGPKSASNIAGAMMKLSAALLIFSAAGLILNKVNWSSLGKMAVLILGISAALAIFSTAAIFLMPGVIILNLFAAAVIGLAGGLTLAALAVFIFVEALSILSVMSAASIEAALIALDLFLAGILGMSESIKKLIVMLIQTLCSALVESIDSITKAIRTIYFAIADLLDELLPDLSGRIFKWLGIILDDLLKFIEKAVSQVFDMVDRLVNEYWPKLMNTLSMMWETFLVTVDGALRLLKDMVFNFVLDFFNDFADFLWNMGDAIHRIFQSIDHLVNDILIPDLIGLIQNTITTLATELATAIGETFETIIGALINLVVDIAIAIPTRLVEGFNRIKEAWKNGFSGAVESDTETMGENAVTKLSTGITNNSWRLDVAAKNLWNRIKGTFDDEAGIHSPSEEMAKIGAFLTEGLAVGIGETASNPLDAIKNLAKDVTNPDLFNFENFGVNIGEDFSKSLAKGDFTIVPDMDLSNIMDGKEDILTTFSSIGQADTTVMSYADNSLVTEDGMNEITEAFAALNNSSDIIVNPTMDNTMIEGEGIGGIKTAFNNLNNSSDVDVVPEMELSKIEQGIERIKEMIRELNNSKDLVVTPSIDTSSTTKSLKKVGNETSKVFSKSVGGSSGTSKYLEEFEAATRAAEAANEVMDDMNGKSWEKVTKYGKDYWVPIEEAAEELRGTNTKMTGDERGKAPKETTVSGVKSILDSASPAIVSAALAATQVMADSTNNGAIGKAVTFIQNNYSPKELSRIDIYRDTNNLLSAAKGV